MTKSKLFLSTIAAIMTLMSAEAFSLKVKVSNNTEQPKYIFFQPKVPPQANVISPYRILVPPTSKGQEYDIEVDENQVGITDYYDIIATDKDENPQKRFVPLATCKDLHKDAIHKIEINPSLGGFSHTCTTPGK